MATVETKLMTAEEFYDWANHPDNRDKHCELERGEIVEMSRPGKRHGFVCGNVVGILWTFTMRRKKGYVCSNDTGVVIERDPDTVRGPDVMLFEDATEYEQLEKKFSETPAALAVEVLSPNDTAGKVMRKVREQLRFGVRMVWVVDPDAQNVTVHEPGKEPQVFEVGQELTGSEALPDFRCPVAEFFVMPGGFVRDES